MSADGRRACVIGAGLGGLALAIRLQAAGLAVTLVEARPIVGGCAGVWQRDGFTFDGGPTAITDPAALADLWALTGHDLAADLELLPITPHARYSWPDGTTFDLGDDAARTRAELERIAPGDGAGFGDYRRVVDGIANEGRAALEARACGDPASALTALAPLARHQGWRSAHALAASHVKSAHLRQALSVHALMSGGNPMTASALAAPPLPVVAGRGMWWPRGGMHRLPAAMLRQFERLGGAVRLHDPVTRIHTIGNRATEVETASGWRDRFSAVASNADTLHTFRDLLAGTRRGPAQARTLARKRYAPGLFQVHFGLEGGWPGIPHHSVLFGPRHDGLLADVFDHGVLPADQLIFLDHPTVTDPSLAPPGRSTFRALVPVAHMGKLTVDWEQVGPLLERRVLAEIGRRLIPDIADRIVTVLHRSPRDHALDLSAHLGSAFGLEPIAAQSGYFRPHNRDSGITNLYLVGAGTHPGPGANAVLASARITAGLMIGDLA